jgi:homopolymeric O-antigen transport system permease protein
MLMNVQNLYGRRELVWSWAERTIRARYQQSVLGGLWAIIQPAASVVVFSIIFTLFIPVDTGGTPYMVFSYVAMVPWTLFSSSITDMVDSLISNMNLVTKIYFPREILPMSSLIARLFDFGIAFGVLAIIIFFYRVPVYLAGWLFLPVILIVELALAFGIGLIGSALNVFYRDMKPLIVLGLQIWFYASPVIYPISSVPERFRSFYYLNPMAGILESYRAVILDQKIPGPYLLIAAGLAATILLIGYWFFKRVEFQFADVV